ncbi:MAG: TetR/AcrR family transcriptional regulator [Anaerolineae bacterium]|nr:TetR/AcrR family transcriptional regulator [Anaerolineae bacterium]
MKTSPRDRRHDLTRQKILDTARGILLAEGVEGISMRVLAEKVDYSPAALYKYFANKEEIVEALRQEAWQMLAAYEPEPPAGVTLPADIFVHAGRSYIRFATQHPEYYRLIMSTIETGPHSIAEFKQNPNFVGLLQLIEAGLASGDFVLPEGFTATHMAMLSWFIVHSISLLKLTMMSKCQDEFESLSMEVIEMVKALFMRT